MMRICHNKKLLIIGIAILLLASCGGNTKPDPTSSLHKNEWYSGGTLHKSIIAEWRGATDKNKLATCSDFMASVDNSVSMDVLKVRSQQLVQCIDEVTADVENTNQEAVTTIASLCLIEMGYQLN